MHVLFAMLSGGVKEQLRGCVPRGERGRKIGVSNIVGAQYFLERQKCCYLEEHVTRRGTF